MKLTFILVCIKSDKRKNDWDFNTNQGTTNSGNTNNTGSTIDLMNTKRLEADLEPLTIDNTLVEVARIRVTI